MNIGRRRLYSQQSGSFFFSSSSSWKAGAGTFWVVRIRPEAKARLLLVEIHVIIHRE